VGCVHVGAPPSELVFGDLGLHSQVPVARRLADQPLPFTSLARAPHLLVAAALRGSLGNHHPTRFQVVRPPNPGVLHGRRRPFRGLGRRLPSDTEAPPPHTAAPIPAVRGAGCVTRRRGHKRRLRRQHCEKPLNLPKKHYRSPSQTDPQFEFSNLLSTNLTFNAGTYTTQRILSGSKLTHKSNATKHRISNSF
jgi:hypothetical protein